MSPGKLIFVGEFEILDLTGNQINDAEISKKKSFEVFVTVSLGFF